MAFPRCFLSCAFAFRSSSRMLLLGWGFGCPVLTSFLYFWFLCLFLSPTVLSSLPVAGSIPRPTVVSLVSFLFFACLVLLFGALPSSPPDVSPVPTSSWAGHPHSFSLLCLLHLNLRSGFHLFLPFLVILFFLGFCPQCFPVLCVGCGFLLFHYSVYFLLSF